MRLLRLAMPIVLSAGINAQPIDLPKNPLRGQSVFEQKRCITCHAISGRGGRDAPDLGRKLYFGSVLELGSIMWNHAPAMNRMLRQANIPRPQFSEPEMLDLFAFLYYLRYLGEPGTVARGKQLVESKGCRTCHRIEGRGGSIGPEFERVQKYDSPLYLVQAMWNHSAVMSREIQKSGLRYPTLTGKDVNDIAAYVHSATRDSTLLRLPPGDWYRGRGVIEAKGCRDCHTIDGRGKTIGPALDDLKLTDGVTGIASKMWNHGPAMMRYMEKLSITWPRFNDSEMADLIAYLYFLGYEDKLGDTARGRNLFVAKGCLSCHHGGGKAPDVAAFTDFASPIRMVQLMWNHSQEMEDLLIVQNKELPRLSTADMQDLYTYLRSVAQP